MRVFLRYPQTDLYTLLSARKCAASFAKQEVYQEITGAVFSALYHAFQQSQCVLYRIKTPPTSSSLCSQHIQNRGWSVYVVLEIWIFAKLGDFLFENRWLPKLSLKMRQQIFYVCCLTVSHSYKM